MKSKFSKLYYLAITILLFTSSSCLKSNDTYVDFSQVGTLIELPLAAYRPTTHTPSLTVYKISVETFMASSTPSDLSVVVNVASPQPLSSDLTVTIGADPQALVDLKTKIGNTTYVLLPASGYTITDPKTVIAGGKRTSTMTIKINTAVIDKSIKTYILPISILDASGQTISKYKTIFYNIKVTS